MKKIKQIHVGFLSFKVRALTFALLLSTCLLFNFSAKSQVFCIGSTLSGNITGYTPVFQTMPGVNAGQAYYWTTTLTAGVPYTWSNCVAEGGTGSDTYLRIYDATNVIVASADDICGVNPTLTYTPAVSGLYYVHLAQYSCGTLATNQVLAYKAILPPSIASFSPASGCGGSVSVVITGANFTGATAVTFGGTNAQSFVINNATQITAVPAFGTTGTIAVTGPSGTGTSAGTFTINPAPAAPTPVTATPAIICAGATTNLNATSAGNIISWFSVPSGGVAVGTSASGVNFPQTPAASTTYYAEAQSPAAPALAPGTITQGAVTLPYVPGGTPMGVVWNPQFSLYYGVAGGSPSYPVLTYNAAGVVQNNVATNIDVRGSWWNSNTNKYEYNAYGSGGERANDLNGSGWALGSGTVAPVGQFQPDAQSMGGYDAANNETVFYNAGQIQRRNRTTGALNASGAITGLPAGSINTYWAAYSGVPGSEIMIYDYTNRAVRFINRLTFAYTASVQLAVTAPQPANYYIGYDGNGKLWLHNGSAWVSYQIVTLGGPGGCPSVRTPVTVTVNPLSVSPTVTATPAIICPGATSQLNSTGTPGSTQSWYTVPSGGVAIGTSLSGANFPVTPAVTTTYYAENPATLVPAGSQTFNFTGAAQTFTVPAGVSSITINALGAQGIGLNGFVPGNGGRAQGTMAVSPGQVLNVYVGGTNAFNGGGIGLGGANGGGASDVRAGGVALADRVIVAGGGGGAGGDNWQCNIGTGHGGGGIAVGANFVGGAGGAGYTFGTGCGADGGNAGGAGANGVGSHGGGGGGGGFISGGGGATAPGGNGVTGTLGQGGASYNAPGCGNTGGGGGGYYGGGGAAGNNCGAGRGGGGSSWTGSLTSPVFQAGVQTGNGQVVISWIAQSTCPSARVPVTVTVNGLAATPNPVTATPASICAGGTSQLNSTGTAGATQSWYTVPSGGVAIGTSLSGANFPVTPAVTTTYYAENAGLPVGTQTFNYTGATQNFTVPAGVTTITIDARGAQGGTFGAATGGLGAKMVGDVTVTPGQVLTVWVGGQGTASQNAGGGGGASGVTNGATALVVAGAGGGGSTAGGTENGKPGLTTTTGGSSSGAGGAAGNGGQKGYMANDCGWAGGGGGFLGDGYGGPSGGDGGALPGTLGGPAGGKSRANGGAGGIGGCCGFSALGAGGWGCGGGARAEYGGGGGGGYSGGGGGQYTAPANSKSGGGGGSFNSGANQVNTQGFQSGDGQVIISWAGVLPCPSTRVPVTVTINPPAATPNPVTATPATICAGATSQLNSTGTAGATQSWYTVPTGGVAIGTSLSGANFPVTPAVTTTYYAENAGAVGAGGTQTFNYTGALQTFTVPVGVTSLTVDVRGAKGGGCYPAGVLGGNGGRVTGTISVAGGQVLNIYVGGQGGNGAVNVAGAGGFNGGGTSGLYSGSYSGGGGGGGSDIRVSPYALANRLAMAGGGGGAGFDCNNEVGGAGGGLVGGDGQRCGGIGAGGTGTGLGGTQLAGGLAVAYPGWCVGVNGALGIGGNGGPCTNAGGGGGGGYYGGGGGAWGSGGGGSSFLAGGVHTQGFQTGNGQVILTWAGAVSCPSVRVPVTVTVNPVPGVTASASPATICAGASSVLTGGGANTYLWNPGGLTGSPTVTPVATTTYTVTGTSAAGCTATSTVTVTVNPVPGVTASASPATICAGASSVLTGGGANTYLWNPGGLTGSPTVTPVATTTYTVTGTAANGCTATSTTTVTVNPLPVLGTTAAIPGTICLGSSTGLTYNGGCFNQVGFAGTYAPANWVTSTTGNSNGTINAAGAPANIVMTSSNGAVGGGAGATNWTITVPCPGNITFDWAYTTVDGPQYDYPRYSINGGIQNLFTGYNTGGGLTQNGSQTIPVLAGDILQLNIYSVDNGFGSCTATITNFVAPGGGPQTVNWYTVPVAGVSLGSGSPFNVTPVTTGVVNYYAQISNPVTGCVNTNRIITPVTVNSFTNLTASANPATICLGGSSVLTGVNGASYVWNPGGLTGSPTVTPIVTTTYTVTGTDANGCTMTTTVTVTVNGTPTVTASASPSALCLGGSAVLTGGGATSYMWNPGALVGSPTVTPIATTNYTVTGTDANGCTGTSSVNVVVNGLPVVTANPVTQTICENGMATISGGGATSYIWTGGIIDATPFVVVAPATYTVTGTDGNGCSNTATAEVLMNAAPVITASATPATTCDMTTVTPIASGAATIVWSGGLTNNVPFVATATTTYTVTGTDGAGCTGSTTVLVTVNPMSGILAPATSNQMQDHGDDFDINYYDVSCDLIATVDDGAGGNVLGLTTSTVNVDAAAGFHNGQPFVRRWYQITPTNNGSADVILYINQSDFDDYNAAVVLPYLPLPTSGNNADPNIPNIRITKNDDAGLGNNPIVITPTVNWNGTYWELSFNTPSFSQFRVHSVNPGNVPLPATITNFSGIKLETSDKLSWTTSSEQNNAYFNLQHSTDGTNFATIAKVNSKAPNGNSASTLTYSHTNTNPNLGHNYYRLQQSDLDNKLSVHAQIVDLIWGANGSTVSIYPNPTTDILNIDLYASSAQNTTVKLLDMSGRVIKQIQAKSVIGMNNIKLSMGEIASGVYTIQVYENNKLSHTSKVKKND